MAHWLLKEYHESVDVLLAPFAEERTDVGYDYPSLFNFYNYLHTHPLIRRRHFTQHRSTSSSTSAVTTSSNSKPKFPSQCSTKSLGACDLRRYERSLYFHTACIHLNSGLPDIALEVLSMLPSGSSGNTLENEDASVFDASVDNPTKSDMIVTGTLSYDANNTSAYNGFSWSAADDFGVKTNRFSDLDDGYQIGISLSDDDDEDNDNAKKTVIEDPKSKVDGAKLDQNNSESSSITVTTADEKISRKDFPALSLKYRCIIQLLIEGLKALPMKCTHEKLKLRSTLKEILQEELDFLHKVCDYEGSEDTSSESVTPKDDENDNIVNTDKEILNTGDELRGLSTILKTGNFFTVSASQRGRIKRSWWCDFFLMIDTQKRSAVLLPLMVPISTCAYVRSSLHYA